MVQLDKKAVSARFLWVFRAGIFLILLSALLFLLGFATDHWHKDGDRNYGLWVQCYRGKCTSQESNSLPDYHIATQVLQILAAIVYTLSPIVHCIMYLGKKKKSTDFRTRIFDVGYCAGTVAHFVSVVVFGLEHQLDYLSWSYNMSAAGVGLGAVGVFLTTVSREKALRVFDGLPGNVKGKHRGSNRVGTSSSRGSSMAGTPSSNKTFILNTQRSIQSQRSTDTEVFNPSSQKDVPFYTASSRLPFDQTLKTSTKVQISSSSLPLEHAVRPSTLPIGQLAPLRVPSTMPLTSKQISG